MRRRPLNPEESALWARVVQDVKPMRGRHEAPQVQSSEGSRPIGHHDPSEVLRSRPTDFGPRLPSSQRSGVAPAKSPTPQNTLDAKWDKRLTKGTVRPDYVIDLHEHSAAEAHMRLEQGLSDAISQGARIVLLITGKARGPTNPRLPPTTRGIIRASAPDWIAGSPLNSSIAAIRNAHARHGGGGALYLILRRSREEAR